MAGCQACSGAQGAQGTQGAEGAQQAGGPEDGGGCGQADPMQQIMEILSQMIKLMLEMMKKGEDQEAQATQA